MRLTYGTTYERLTARVQKGRKGDSVAYIGAQLCFFERDAPIPPLGTEIEVMITRPIHPRDAQGFLNNHRLTALVVRPVNPELHLLVAIDGFECSGSMCSTTSSGTLTDGTRAISYEELRRRFGRALEATFTITPGRSGIRYADNVNARFDRRPYKETIPTNVWVDRDPRTGRPQLQPRGMLPRVAGLTRIEDLECASLVRRAHHEANAGRLAA